MVMLYRIMHTYLSLENSSFCQAIFEVRGPPLSQHGGLPTGLAKVPVI